MKENGLDNGVHFNILKASQKNEENIWLKDVTSFEWDYVCFISSYDQNHSKKFYEEEVGFEFEGAVPESYGSSEGQTLLLFVNKKNKESKLINFDKLEKRNNTHKLCIENTNVILKPQKTQKYRKGFFVFNNKFLIELNQ